MHHNYFEMKEMGSCSQLAAFRSEVWQMLYALKSYIEKVVDPITQQEGLTALQTFVLASIQQGDADSIGSLCKITGMNQSNASTLCKRMEREGVLTRSRTAKDERVVQLTVTSAGNEALLHIEQRFAALDPLLMELPDGQLEQVRSGFHAAAEVFRYLAERMEEEGKTASC